jgi:TolA-binding protein
MTVRRKKDAEKRNWLGRARHRTTMVTARPGDSQVIWLKMGMAIASIHLAEDEAVDAVLQNIISEHGSDDRASEALNHIGWAYRKLGRYSEALTIYQYVVNNWAQKDRVVFAQQSIAVCQIRLGDRQAADEALQVMLQKFGTDESASKLLAWAVYEYLQAGETEGAYKVFDLVLQTYPEKPETIEALLSLATAVIQGNDRARIEPTVQTLLTRFAPTEVKAGALHTVANMLGWKCRDYGNYPLEEQNPPGICNRCLLAIANYTLATWPKSDWAMWAERDLATAAMHRGDNPSAEAAISRLSTDYADRKGTPEALNFLADYCLQLRKDGRAERVYQHVVKEYPTYDLILLAKVGLGVIQIRRGNDTDAEAIFQRVLTDYANHPRLPEAINLMAEGYWTRGLELEGKDRSQATAGTPPPLREVPLPVKESFGRAIDKWSIILQRYPDVASVGPGALYFSAMSYSRQGDPAKAVEYYQTFLERWPDDERNQQALLRLPSLYKEMVLRGLLTERRANPLIRAAYDQFIGKYPSSPAAEMARQQARYYGAIMEGNTHEE